jgi:hypothetical protein
MSSVPTCWRCKWRRRSASVDTLSAQPRRLLPMTSKGCAKTRPPSSGGMLHATNLSIGGVDGQCCRRSIAFTSTNWRGLSWGGNRDTTSAWSLTGCGPPRIFAVHWREPSVPRVITPKCFPRAPIRREGTRAALPRCGLVVLQKLPPQVRAGEAPGEDRVDDACRTVDDVERRRKA